MKFTCSVDINQPREKIVELFANPANLGHWQKGFVRLEHISGVPGEPGAKSRIIFQTGNRVMELIETIQVSNLPQEMTGLYEHKHMVNTMTNRFYARGEAKSTYEAEIHYTKFVGIIPNMMALLMPGIFRRQVQESLDRFKKFAEEEPIFKSKGK